MVNVGPGWTVMTTFVESSREAAHDSLFGAASGGSGQVVAKFQRNHTGNAAGFVNPHVTHRQLGTVVYADRTM